MTKHVAFLAPVPIRTQVQKTSVCRSKATHLACATSAQPNLSSTKDASIAPAETRTKSDLPTTLIGTTVLHNIPSHPPHIPTNLAHPLDGDGYILAISFQQTCAPWIRGRFVRTKPFMAETKAGKRLFRGRYGTPGATGWDAPLKPKAASAGGAFLWGKGKKRRAFAWGIRALPIALDIATLVSKGPTALGAALTDSVELASERATELAAQPVSHGDSLFMAGVGRAQNGRVLGAFVAEIDRDYKVCSRTPKVLLPARCEIVDFAVGDTFCVLLLHRVMAESGMGVLGTLLGRKQETQDAPLIDVEFGTEIIVLPRDGSAAASFRLAGEILCSIVEVEDSSKGELSLSLLTLQGQNEKLQGVSTSTVADIRCGFISGLNVLKNDKVRVGLKRLSVDVRRSGQGLPKTLSVSEAATGSSLGQLSLLRVSKAPSNTTTKRSQVVFSTYDHSSGRCGLAVADTGTPDIDVQRAWLAEEGFNVGTPLLHNDNQHVCILVTSDDLKRGPSCLMTFKTDSLHEGPVHVVELDKDEFGMIGSSVGGVWETETVDWSEEGSKPVKSAYEIFDSRRWNDIESGFSSLGLGQ